MAATQQQLNTEASRELEKRRDALNREIERYVKAGYRVLSQSDTSAQLVKPKRISLFWILVFLVLSLLLVGLILLLLYFVWYWTQKDEQVYLTVDEHAHVHATKRKG